MNERHEVSPGQAGAAQPTGAKQAGGNGPDRQGPAGSTEGWAEQVQNTAFDLGSGASDMAREAYDQGQRYVRQARERYPQAQRYYERATQTIGQAPVLSLLAVGAAGLGLAWLIGNQTRGQERASYRARSRGDYPGQRSGKPLIESDRVEGTAVYDGTGHRIGTVERVMIDKISGRVAYAVMSFGGFFGLGTTEYAVPWSMLDYDPRLKGYRTQITAEQLHNAPSLSGQRGQDWPERGSERDLHDYYQVSYYWVLT